MSTVQSYLNELWMMSTNMIVSRKQRKEKSCIYRDELDKKKLLQKPLIQKRSAAGEDDETGRRGFKVKVLMTKEEAARLLAKCKDGRRLEMKDLTHELSLIPANRVNAAFNSISGDCRLQTIAEET